MNSQEVFEREKEHALRLVDAEEPIEAITAIVRALDYVLGRDCDEIALSLKQLDPGEGYEGLRAWIRGLG